MEIIDIQNQTVLKEKFYKLFESQISQELKAF